MLYVIYIIICTYMYMYVKRTSDFLLFYISVYHADDFNGKSSTCVL